MKGHSCTCSHSCTEDIKIYYKQFWRNQLNVRVLIAMIFVYLDYMNHMLFWETERRGRESAREREREKGEKERIFLLFKKQSVLLKKLIQFKTGSMKKANSLFRSFTYHKEHASLYLESAICSLDCRRNCVSAYVPYWYKWYLFIHVLL